MKKIISFIMVLTMILAAFTGCAKPEDGKKPGTTTESSEPERFIYDRVCIIGCDGAGTFFKQAETPNIDRIFANGAVTYECLAMDPTISAQCWGSMIHGVLPEFHLLDNTNTAKYPYSPTSDFPSFFRVVRENDLTCKLASFCKWDNINVGIVEDGIGVYKYIAADDVITEKACEYIQDKDPKVMLVVLNDPDTGGHTYGYGSQGQLDMIKVTDERIGMIYDAYEAKGWLDTTLFIVTADHGGVIGNTGHGGWSDAEKYVMFAALGKTVSKGTVGEMDLRDVASIVTYALGYDQPDTWTSRVPSGLFEGVEAGERPVYEREFDSEFRAHESVPTPAIGSSKNVIDVLGADRVKAYLTFDDNVNDATGKVQTTKNKNLVFEDGFFGKGANIKEGSVSLKNFALGTESFTVMLWVKATAPISSDPLLFGNKDWKSGANPGVAFSMRAVDLKFNLASSVKRHDQHYTLPNDYMFGWLHLTIVYDREAGDIKLSMDFDDYILNPMPNELKQASLDGLGDLVIGQDATLNYSANLPAIIDEFVFIEGALSAEDLAKVKNVYSASLK